METVRIVGLGSALPERVVRNEELAELTGFPAERMREFFEIEERRWSRGVRSADPDPGQRCSDLATLAARRAIEDAGISVSDLGALLVATTSPDSINPPLDSIIVRNLGATDIASFTLQAPCTGIFRATLLARSLLCNLPKKHALVVGAETISPFFRFGPALPHDHVLNSILYADGAAAIVVGVGEGDGHVVDAIDLSIGSEPIRPGLTFPGMMSAFPPTEERFRTGDYLGYHDFRRVLSRGGAMAAGAARRVMATAGVSDSEVAYFITHQATGNIHRIGAAYGFPPEKLPVNISCRGNTVSASILLLLDELYRSSTFRSGDRLVLHTAESSTWSSAGMLVRW